MTPDDPIRPFVSNQEASTVSNVPRAVRFLTRLTQAKAVDPSTKALAEQVITQISDFSESL